MSRTPDKRPPTPDRGSWRKRMIAVRVPVELVDRLDELANERPDTTRTDLIIVAIESYVRRGGSGSE